MSISVGTVLKVVAVLSFTDGNILQNVFNAAIAGSGGPYDDGDIVDDAVTWVTDMLTEVILGMVDDIDGSEVRVYEYDPIDEDFDEVGSAAFPFNPASAIGTLPRGVAALVNCKTTDPDVNGKKYLGGFDENMNLEAYWSSTMTGYLAAFASEWVTPFTGSVSAADWVPGVWSPTRLNHYAMSGDVIIPTIPAYQRRRKQGVGI